MQRAKAVPLRKDKAKHKGKLKYRKRVSLKDVHICQGQVCPTCNKNGEG